MTFKVAVVFDAFSRMPLSVGVFSKETSALEIAHLASRTERRRGRPAHFVSDHARCFTGKAFRRRLRRLEVKQRFWAVGKKGSIALIERLWRTLNDSLGLRLLRPLAAPDLLKTVELGLVHYAHFRPHQALGGATPAEVYFGRTPALSRQSRLLVAGRAKARGIRRFASSTSMSSGGCRFWFEKLRRTRPRALRASARADGRVLAVRSIRRLFRFTARCNSHCAPTPRAISEPSTGGHMGPSSREIHALSGAQSKGTEGSEAGA